MCDRRTQTQFIHEPNSRLPSRVHLLRANACIIGLHWQNFWFRANFKHNQRIQSTWLKSSWQSCNIQPIMLIDTPKTDYSCKLQDQPLREIEISTSDIDSCLLLEFHDWCIVLIDRFFCYSCRCSKMSNTHFFQFKGMRKKARLVDKQSTRWRDVDYGFE